ncbi:MAG: hypothetical protein PUE48_07775 [Eubacterium coprostanoligenes]|uniref:hypothetical protein n=1 Tax=Eubacterium coprostanoligenes TaxID=290054 RepID=UPI002409B9BC|nr:hypothetical protein [Eubacterium coprostanoligenes]MDD6666216.1 hypothetical protein [Eubacterium coprostanoligenes]
MNSIYNFHPLQKLWNYEGNIYDMGLEPDEQGKPAFYILTESGEHITVTITRHQELSRVMQYLNLMKTGVNVEFKDYAQFNKVIQKVFSVYGQRFGLLMHFDNTNLKYHMEALKGFATEYDVARIAGLGRSTVNDLTRGITHRPRFFTICRVYSAIYELEHRKKALA